MLKNEELKSISNASTMLLFLKRYALETDTFYEDTGITIADIEKLSNELHHIHNKYALKKIAQSEKSNAWNKAHPEQHRRHNRDYERRKKALKGGA